MPEATTEQKRHAREYELVYILNPQVDPDAAEKISNRIIEIVARLGGKITKVDHWGRRKLAYMIGKFTRGVFVCVRMVGYSDLVAEVERNLRNADMVIRFQTVRREGTFELDSLTIDPEEVKFQRVEAASPEEEAEPSFEERLGLLQKPRERVEEDDMSHMGGSEDDVVPGSAVLEAAAPEEDAGGEGTPSA
jgi:small subunit ribosomal protein S6